MFNFGVPGNNSTQVRVKLEFCLKRLRPDAVVVLAGCNDNWNFDRVAWQWEWLGTNAVICRSKLYRILNGFAHSARLVTARPLGSAAYARTQKILTRLDDPSKLVEYGNVYRFYQCYGEAELFYQKALGRHPDRNTVILELERCYKLNGAYAKAQQILLEALRNDPDNEQLYAELDDVLIRGNDIRETLRAYTDLMNRFPDNKDISRRLARAYIHQAGEYLINNRLQAAENSYRNAFALDPENEKSLQGMKAVRFFIAQDQSFLKQLLSQQYSLYKLTLGYMVRKLLPVQKIAEELQSQNLVAMARQCRKYNVPLIFSGYPASVSSPMRAAAASEAVPLVEHRLVFEQLNAFVPGSVFFISEYDPHCTAKGYRVMAENIAEVVMREINKPCFP